MKLIYLLTVAAPFFIAKPVLKNGLSIIIEQIRAYTSKYKLTLKIKIPEGFNIVGTFVIFCFCVTVCMV